MVGILFIGLALWALLLWKVGDAYNGFLEYRRRAQETGFPVIETRVILALAPIGLKNILTLKFIIPILRRLPGTKHWGWLYIANHRNSFLNLRSSYDLHGDTYIFATSNLNLLRTTNAELIAQFTIRKTDFVKPVKNYKVLEFFGKNILTIEGAEWRRHKKVVGKSFGEKSIKLVWAESIRQAEGMIRIWGRRGRSSEKGDEELRVEDAGSDTAILSLHVICAVGFGVPQLWEGEEEEDVGNGDLKIEGEEMPNLGLSKPVGEHSLGFKDCISMVLSSLLLILLWQQWMLKLSPVKRHRQVYKAFKETNEYVTGLLEHKKKQISAGDYDKVTMDLLGNMLKASTGTLNSPKNSIISNKNEDLPLTEAEIKSNAFIFLLAGHETTASSIQLCFIYLAISVLSQTSMQADIDLIVGSKKPQNWTYTRVFPELYNSMVGAVLNEELRLMPIADTIPKITVGEQKVIVDGVEKVVPEGCFIHLNTVGTHRNPRYWPHRVSEGGSTDLNDFVPERWIVEKGEEREKMTLADEDEDEDSVKDEIDNESSTLFKPVKGAFIPFSEGPRACPGKKFAQVEMIAVLTVIFQKYSVELDVSRWASDEEVQNMNDEERREVYEKAIIETKEVLRRCNQAQIVLKMAKEDKVPLKFVERGKERFRGF
ncbi:putative cytochrome p450 monooxygenase protein [Botrytis fragariae]|uniref:Putative cytochrome p450 monooxygenase protein n=1 Tax=Botrytis fragariae TaxID=1964551 RepID=A0A8H6ATJ7_9HELO|nr:putative cytochrome p450 monooxygenase protein [Botrytis fragariae]KAF5873351.1 putative cytochrome p450 monooxygenase protein [Botrytis fragariae]